MKQHQNIITVITLSLLLAALAVANFLKPASSYSAAERRALAQMPAISREMIQTGQYMSRFESFATDQFPMRDSFRQGKALFSRHILRQKDNNGFYLENGYLSRLEYPLADSKWEKTLAALQNVYRQYLAGTDCQIYAAMIPDKNAYLAPVGGYPALDYGALAENYASALDFARSVDLSDQLTLNSFYRTDQHWRQETLRKPAQTLTEVMGVEWVDEFTTRTLDVPFYGTYYGQAALPMEPDTLRYLTSNTLDACQAISYDTGKPEVRAVYDMALALGRDPYEMFLGGSDALLVLENPNAETERELVIFRDSFGSSLAPLLAQSYAKITLVDLRYLRSDKLADYLTFDHQDVLFLYSTLILNSGAIV